MLYLSGDQWNIKYNGLKSALGVNTNCRSLDLSQKAEKRSILHSGRLLLWFWDKEDLE